MKQYVQEFFRRGMIACGFGPIILAMLYLILQHQGVVELLTVKEVCLGIFSLSWLAFMAGGMNVIYQIERLPLMIAIFVHGVGLYICYLATYLLNDWLVWGTTPILVFSGIFVVGYLLVWVFIYVMTRQNAEKLNQILKEKQQNRK